MGAYRPPSGHSQKGGYSTAVSAFLFGIWEHSLRMREAQLPCMDVWVAVALRSVMSKRISCPSRLTTM